MVFHRGQSAHPGRAHRHRGHHRRRSGALANSRRPGLRTCTARRSTCRRRGKFRAWVAPCNAASPPKTRKTNSRPITAGFSPIAPPAATACGWTAAWVTPARSSRPFTIRCWSRSPAFGREFRAGPATHGPRLARISHPRRQDEYSVSGKRHRQSRLPLRPGHHHADRHHARTFQFKPRRDRATKLLAFLGDVIVNGNPQAKGHTPKAPLPPVDPPEHDRKQAPPPGTRQLLLETGRRKNLPNGRSRQKQLLITDTTFRDAHQSLLATRVRSYDMLAIAPAVARRTPQFFSLEMWGGATFDTAMRFLHEDPWDAPAALARKNSEHLFPNALSRRQRRRLFQLSGQRRRRLCQTRRRVRASIFSAFSIRSITRPICKAAMDAVQETHAVCEAAICYTGDILDPKRTKYSLKYYVKLAQGIGKNGRAFSGIKDMAGLCRPFAAHALVKALKEEIGPARSISTRTTPAASIPPPCCKPARRGSMWWTWPSLR